MVIRRRRAMAPDHSESPATPAACLGRQLPSGAGARLSRPIGPRPRKAAPRGRAPHSCTRCGSAWEAWILVGDQVQRAPEWLSVHARKHERAAVTEHPRSLNEVTRKAA